MAMTYLFVGSKFAKTGKTVRHVGRTELAGLFLGFVVLSVGKNSKNSDSKSLKGRKLMVKFYYFD